MRLVTRLLKRAVPRESLVAACAPPADADQRSDRNAARISSLKSSGSSQAAK
jgi:hypothetical protein